MLTKQHKKIHMVSHAQSSLFSLKYYCFGLTVETGKQFPFLYIMTIITEKSLSKKNNWKVLWLANRHVSDVGLIWINGWVDGFHSICFYGHDNNLISVCNFYLVDGSDSICFYGHDNPYLSSSTLRKKIITST